MARKPQPSAPATRLSARYIRMNTTVDMTRSLSRRAHVRVEARSHCVRLTVSHVRDHFWSDVKKRTRSSGLIPASPSIQRKAVEAQEEEVLCDWNAAATRSVALVAQEKSGRFPLSERSTGGGRLSKFAK